MSKRTLHLAMVALITATLCSQAMAIDVSWDGGGDGYSWGDANNWEPNIVPDGNYDVIFDGTMINIEVFLATDRLVNQLDCNGTVELFGTDWLSLNVSGPNGLRNYGNLEVSDHFVITGKTTNYGYMEVADIELEGLVTNTADANFEFEDPGTEINGDFHNLSRGTTLVESLAEIKKGDVENNGRIKLQPLGQMMFENNFFNFGEILLYGGSLLYWPEEGGPGIFDNNSTGLIQGFGMIESGNAISNGGTIYAYGGDLFMAVNGNLANSGTIGNLPIASLHLKPRDDLHNAGMVEVSIGGSVSFDCNLVNMADASIYLHGGTLAATNITQKAGATFEGQGDISGNLAIDPNGLVRLTGPANIFGDVQIDPNATLEISDGTTLITGHCTCDNGIIHMIGGRLIPQGGFTNNNCNIIWEPGLYNNIADFNLDGTVNLKDFADFAETWLWQSQL